MRYAKINATTNVVENLEVHSSQPTATSDYYYVSPADGTEYGIDWVYDRTAQTFSGPSAVGGASDGASAFNLFLSAETIANGFGTRPANSGTSRWTHTIQVDGSDALRVDGVVIAHSSDADYEFTFTPLHAWTLTGSNRDTTSSGLRYNGRDLFIGVSGSNFGDATRVRLDILKELTAASSDFNDFKGKVARL